MDIEVDKNKSAKDSQKKTQTRGRTIYRDKDCGRSHSRE
jgi:hypothetical protein